MATLGSLMPWRDKSTLPAVQDSTYDPFVSLRREMDRMFDDFFQDFGPRSLASWNSRWPQLTPVINIADSDKELVVTAELPGLDDKDFDVTIAGDILTIKGEKRAETEKANDEAYYAERRFGSFSRSLRLPFEVKDEKIDAQYDKGVLTVRVPKPAEAQHAVRHIDVKTH